MNMKQAFLGAVSLVASVSASATVVDVGLYMLDYDELTAFGDPTFSSGPGNTAIFSWSLGSAVNYLNIGPAAPVDKIIVLPRHTITAKPGFSLSGPVSTFSGNPIYTEFGGAVTTMAMFADLSVNGGPLTAVSASFVKTPIIVVPDLAVIGTMSLSSSAAIGGFSTLEVSSAALFLTSTPTTLLSLAAIQSRAIDSFTVSFLATPVPVPPAAWLLSSALLGLVLRRRAS